MTETTWAPSGEVVGLTDKPRLPRLGKLHLGVKKVSSKGNEYPSAVDYFVVPPTVQKVYGEKPRELDIVFPTDEVARVAPVAWKMYSASRGKVCTGDGERAARLVDVEKVSVGPKYEQAMWDAALVSKDTKKAERVQIPCPAKDCMFAQRNLCKPVMNLQFLLPSVPGIGVWQLDTGSINSIIDVRGGIELVMKLSGGRLAGIPLKLRIEPMEVVNPDDQKKKTVFTLKLISPATLGKVLMAGDHNLRELLMADDGEARVQLPELPAPREVPPPQEPEEDLYPASVIEQRAGSSVRAESSAPEERLTTGGEVAGSTPAPRSDIGDEMAAAASDMHVAAEVEDLFRQLETPPKEREMYRNAYRGRAVKLRDMLRTTLAKKQGGKR